MSTTLEKYAGHLNIWISVIVHRNLICELSVVSNYGMSRRDKYRIEIVLFFRSVKQAEQVRATSHLAHDFKLF